MRDVRRQGTHLAPGLLRLRRARHVPAPAAGGLPRLKEEISSEEKDLREERERIAEWLEDAERKEERADGMRSLIGRLGAKVQDPDAPTRSRSWNSFECGSRSSARACRPEGRN